MSSINRILLFHSSLQVTALMVFCSCLYELYSKLKDRKDHVFSYMSSCFDSKINKWNAFQTHMSSKTISKPSLKFFFLSYQQNCSIFHIGLNIIPLIYQYFCIVNTWTFTKDLKASFLTLQRTQGKQESAKPFYKSEIKYYKHFGS